MFKDEWNKKHATYSNVDWIDKPSLFSHWALQFFPKQGKVLDIGCGQGQDSRFFSDNGYDVTGIDFSDEGMKFAHAKSQSGKHKNITFLQADISEKMPFEDSSFDVVYSHLALHYFNKEKTQEIFDELYRVLKKGGILAFLVNSIHDPEYGTGQQIEEGYYAMSGIQKHFFSADSLAPYVKDFEAIVIDEKGETYKDRAINTTNLVRFVGRK